MHTIHIVWFLSGLITPYTVYYQEYVTKKKVSNFHIPYQNESVVCSSVFTYNPNVLTRPYVTGFAKTRHNRAFFEIHIFTPWCSML